MILKKWEKLPAYMQTDEVRPYYEALRKKRVGIVLKRCFDIVFSIVLLVLLIIPMLIIGVMVCIDSPGGPLYIQERITTYGKKFKILKFRTMTSNRAKAGSSITMGDDARITSVGKKLRNIRLDELPQLVNVLLGDMSFVGTRPEVEKYVKQYTNEMYATLLLPAGITSEASIRYKNEAQYLEGASSEEEIDEIYVNKILPEKMVFNLESVIRFKFLREILTMIRTVLAVLGKNYG